MSSICEKCLKEMSTTEPEQIEKEVKTLPTIRSRGRPLIFKTKEEKVVRKSEYNKRYYDKMKMRLRNEIQKDNNTT
jgi:hypothetical protein